MGFPKKPRTKGEALRWEASGCACMMDDDGALIQCCAVHSPLYRLAAGLDTKADIDELMEELDYEGMTARKEAILAKHGFSED